MLRKSQLRNLAQSTTHAQNGYLRSCTSSMMEPISEGPVSQRSDSEKSSRENDGGDESGELSMSWSDISVPRENLWGQSLEEEDTQVSNRHEQHRKNAV